jgi:hypothetical protein
MEILFLLVGIGLAVLRVYMVVNKLKRSEQALPPREPEPEDPALLALIESSEAEGPVVPLKEGSSAAPYRASGRAEAPKVRSTGPIADVITKRCARCDMRWSGEGELCATCRERAR